MSEMIETVRVALDSELTLILGPKFAPAFAQRLARAAIKAMREPTLSMKDAGHRQANPMHTPEGIWRAMIDEALRD